MKVAIEQLALPAFLQVFKTLTKIFLLSHVKKQTLSFDGFYRLNIFGNRLISRFQQSLREIFLSK